MKQLPNYFEKYKMVNYKNLSFDELVVEMGKSALFSCCKNVPLHAFKKEFNFENGQLELRMVKLVLSAEIPASAIEWGKNQNVKNTLKMFKTRSIWYECNLL